MASVLQLTDGTTTVNFLTGNAYLREGGWETQGHSGELVWETFELASGATDANIRTVQAQIDELIQQARDYATDINENVPVVLQWQSDGESAKQALIYDGATEVLSGNRISPLLGVNGAFLRVALQRDDWEATSGTNTSTTGLSSLGGTWSIGNAAGSAHQRISKFKVGTSYGGISIGKVWAGIRPTRNGTAGFISKWDCDQGTPISGDTLTYSGDTGGGGTSVTGMRTTFSTATLAQRFSVRWNQIQTSSNWDDLVGTYLVLGRLRLESATDEIRIQLRHGWSWQSLYADIVGDTFLSAIDNSNLTNYNLVELGTVSIPPTGNRDSAATTSGSIKYYSLQLYAEKVSSSAALRVNCFVLIPTEHMVACEGAVIDTTNSGEVEWYTGADGYQYGINSNSSEFWGNCQISIDPTWYYPKDGGLLVIAAQPSSLHWYAATVNTNITLYPRYHTFRV